MKLYLLSKKNIYEGCKITTTFEDGNVLKQYSIYHIRKSCLQNECFDDLKITEIKT